MNPNIHTATATPPTFEVDPTLPGTNFFATVRSELIKLKALRTTWWLSGVTLVLGALIAAGLAVSYRLFAADDTEFTSGALDLANQGQAGSFIAMVLLGSMGVIAVTTEYSSGAIRSTLTAVPKRGLLLGAKATALSLWTAAVAAALILASHLVTSVVVQPLGVLDIFGEQIAAMYLGHLITIVLAALLGFGLGTLLRSSAGGIVVLAVIMFVLQIVLSIMYAATDGAVWVETLLRVEYMNLVDNFTNPNAGGEFSLVPAWEPWQAGIGLLIWTAVPLLLGAIGFIKRDS